MPKLREALAEAGFRDVQTYVQSGNVVLSSSAKPETVARKCERVIAEGFGLEIPVVVRTRDELAKVVARNPLADVADNPKRYQVTFLDGKLAREVAEKLEAALVERVREVVAEPPVLAGDDTRRPALADPTHVDGSSGRVDGPRLRLLGRGAEDRRFHRVDVAGLAVEVRHPILRLGLVPDDRDLARVAGRDQ